MKHARLSSAIKKRRRSAVNARLFSLIIAAAPVVGFAQDDCIVREAWGDIDYDGRPWVENVSRPNKIKHGLRNRHIALWASHGRYYDANKGRWKWQRPNLFCTTEDLFTQTIVVPYLMPMLENAGAVVFSPRERDWQTQEIIIDNDDFRSGVRYFEFNDRRDWQPAPQKGFAQHAGVYADGENPFQSGTARMAKATKGKHLSLVSYQPRFAEDGRYAVYVSYQSLERSVTDAQYIVYHKGIATEVHVNQRMGGGTWVYLGTFDFGLGSSEANRVVVTNKSRDKGFVTTDAVRFGGGMGNIERYGTVSGLPRCLEGARYYAQWAGAPYSVYSSKQGADDYGDDINVRSLMSNWLGGGSCYMPALDGKHVPLELSLAVHSDAGYARNGRDLIGSLAVCTTGFNDGLLNSGTTRMASKDFAKALLDGIMRDIPALHHNWARRYLWDRNYSETRLPEVPSAIFETLSHQNFPDMVLGQDPNFKFNFARSIYKTIARFIARQHDRKVVIQPLRPLGFKAVVKDGKAYLSWRPQTDILEPSAKPTSYNIYTAVGDGGFDNGTNTDETQITLPIEPYKVYNFRCTACNDGGESFPTEVLSVFYNPSATKMVLVVNGFDRLSAPAVVNDARRQGFDLDQDAGVSLGLTAGWAGRQQYFNRQKMGIEGEGGLGYGGDELAGRFVMGNTFDYVRDHANAIASAGRYNVASCSMEALLSSAVDVQSFACVDLILGLQKTTPWATHYYKTLVPEARRLLQNYARQGGALLVSGSYVGSDMNTQAEADFLRQTLKVNYQPTDSIAPTDSVNGLGLDFNYYHELNPRHYAVQHAEVLSPAEGSGAICAMRYTNGSLSAAVAYKGTDYSSFTMGFPLESVVDKDKRQKLVRGILNYLIEK